jgi:hypothetical protein
MAAEKEARILSWISQLRPLFSQIFLNSIFCAFHAITTDQYTTEWPNKGVPVPKWPCLVIRFEPGSNVHSWNMGCVYHLRSSVVYHHWEIPPIWFPIPLYCCSFGLALWGWSARPNQSHHDASDMLSEDVAWDHCDCVWLKDMPGNHYSFASFWFNCVQTVSGTSGVPLVPPFQTVSVRGNQIAPSTTFSDSQLEREPVYSYWYHLFTDSQWNQWTPSGTTSSDSQWERELVYSYWYHLFSGKGK